MTVRVLIADDQQLVRAGVRMLCETAADLEVVGEATGGADAVRLAARSSPDVILMDLRMPSTDGIQATQQILAARPATRIVALTTFDDDENLYRALQAGMCGFLVKDSHPTQLLDAIHRAADGDPVFSPDILRRVIGTALTNRPTTTAPRGPALTPREREVLALLAEGLPNAEIGARLNMGITTVKTHVANLMAKTGTDNRVRLAVHGLRTLG
ncbi:response regulator transcription factor [Nocardia salmonicida]|uniref:response regulator transcription factor n=1 Tax=Nocardia salmonicida TaxID=53431 RepID=UPI003433B557